MQINSSISKLRQNFKAAQGALEGLSPPHRRLVWLGGGGLLLIFLYLAVVNPLLSLEESWSQALASRSRTLSQYQKLLQSKSRVVEANKTMKATLTRTEAQFLSGANPAVASADLQEILKNLAKEQGVQMSSTKVLPGPGSGTVSGGAGPGAVDRQPQPAGEPAVPPGAPQETPVHSRPGDQCAALGQRGQGSRRAPAGEPGDLRGH